MDEVIAALRLAKERAVESEKWDDLTVFRSAEKRAMSARNVLAQYGHAIAEVRESMDTREEKETSWSRGFEAGADWVLHEIADAVSGTHADT